LEEYQKKVHYLAADTKEGQEARSILKKAAKNQERALKKCDSEMDSFGKIVAEIR